MASGFFLLILEEIFLALCTICLLHRYADVKKLNKVILICVALAWFLSLNVILLLPLDVSVALYEQCLSEKVGTYESEKYLNNASIGTGAGWGIFFRE